MGSVAFTRMSGGAKKGSRILICSLLYSPRVLIVFASRRKYSSQKVNGSCRV